ncbi:MAG: shikimate dehydrogenase [Thermodesulfobacteriota bacterium]
MADEIAIPIIPQRIFGVLGHPVAHSLSPALHNWAFRELSVPAVYLAFDKTPEELPDFLRAVRALPVSGLSVTIPHKVAVMEALDGVSGLAKRVGAVNTLYWDQKRLLGENTDITGFLEPLRELGRAPGSALVLGAGGAARAVLAGLLDLGVPRIALANRTPDKARDLAEEFGVDLVPWDLRQDADAELVVNTTPLGMAGERQDLSPWADICMSPSQTAYDLVYNPQKTRFLADAENMGCRTIDGLSMFVAQAQAQLRLWTGREFPAQPARQLLRQLL